MVSGEFGNLSIVIIHIPRYTHHDPNIARFLCDFLARGVDEKSKKTTIVEEL